MTTNTYSRREITNLVKEIAAFLGEGWNYDQKWKAKNDNWKITHTSGMGIIINLDSYHQTPRLIIHGSFCLPDGANIHPYLKVRMNSPTISVNASVPPAGIVKEILLKLLPDYKMLFKAALAEYRQGLALKETQNAIALRLATSIGAKPKISGNILAAPVGKVYVRGEVSSGIRLVLTGLSENQAMAILQILVQSQHNV